MHGHEQHGIALAGEFHPPGQGNEGVVRAGHHHPAQPLRLQPLAQLMRRRQHHPLLIGARNADRPRVLAAMARVQHHHRQAAPGGRGPTLRHRAAARQAGEAGAAPRPDGQRQAAALPVHPRGGHRPLQVQQQGTGTGIPAPAPHGPGAGQPIRTLPPAGQMEAQPRRPRRGGQSPSLRGPQRQREPCHVSVRAQGHGLRQRRSGDGGPPEPHRQHGEAEAQEAAPAGLSIHLQ